MIKSFLLGAEKLFEKLKKNLPLIIICIFGTFLRFYKLSFLVFHLDESPHTVQIAAKSLSYVLTHDYGSIVYQVFAHILLPMGKLELMSRLPAALFGILIILGTYYVGKLFFGKRIGLTAALFVSFSHYLISYSQYARAYTTFTLFSLFSLYFFYKAIKGNEAKYWVLYIIFAAINAYTHLITLMTLISYAAFVGILLLDKKIKGGKKKSWQIDKNRLIRFILCTLAIIAITFLLRLPVGEEDGGEISSLDWIAVTLERLLGEPTIGLFPLIQQIFTHHFYYFPSLFYFVAVFFIALGICSCLIRLRKEDILVLVYTLLPILSFYLIKPRPIFFLVADRYFIFLLPIFFILLVRGIALFSSLLMSLASFLKAEKKRAHFHKNQSFVVFVMIFFLLECFSLIGYSNYVWKIRSLSLNKSVQSLLMDLAETGEILFSNSFPDSSNVLQLIPLALNKGQKRLIVQSRFSEYLEKISRDALGLWLVIDRSLLDEEKTKTFSENLEGRVIQNVDEHSLIYWKAGGKILSKKLIEMVDILILLHSEREIEYRLLQTKFHLLDLNLEKAMENLNWAENNGFLYLGGKKKSETAQPILKFINIFLGDIKDYRQIVLDTLQADIGRQLWILGTKLLIEENWDEGVKALDKCVQLSEEFHKSVSQKYFFFGNQFLRSGRTDQAIIFLNKAIELNPDNYFYHLILAEAYWDKSMVDESISQHKIGFSDPSLSDEFVRQIVSKPQLFAVWVENKTWHFLWRSDKKSQFSGNIYFDKKFDSLQKHHLSKKDILDQYKDYAVEFNVSTNERGVKTLDIEIGGRSQLTCYVKIDDQLKPNDIVFINTGENPKDIPFSASSKGLKRANQKND